MGPLSAKQHREYLKFNSQEQREKIKMEQDQGRKQQLHEIKLQEAAAKANQSIGHKEQMQQIKLKDAKSILDKPPRMNRQKLGLPSTNPMAGTGMFKQGQHRLEDGTDTVPAMLTPGEAVIPEPAAQDPKNKEIIKQLVNEGREANALRNGTTHVANYNYGTPSVRPAMYVDGTTEVSFLDRLLQGIGFKQPVNSPPPVSSVPVNAATEVTPIAAPAVVKMPEAVTIPVTPQAVTEVPPATTLVVPETIPVATPVTVPAAPVVAPVAIPPGSEDVLSAVPNEAKAIVPAVAPAVVPPIAPSAVTEIVPPIVSTEVTPTAVNVVDTSVTENDRLNNASKSLRSKEDSIKAYMKMQGFDPDQPKDTKGFVDTFKDALSYSGVKEALGLNNQELARMAVMAVGGRALGYNFNKSLAYAGKNMFLEANKRATQESADKKAAMRNAVTMAQQDVRNEQLDTKEENRYKQSIAREDRRDERQRKDLLARDELQEKRTLAREAHNRFLAEQQIKLAEIRENYNRTRDDKKFEQQLEILSRREAAQHARMVALFGQQFALADYKAGLADNSPNAQMRRMQDNTNNASKAVGEIFDTVLGSSNVRDKPNPARQGLPTPVETTQQALSFLKKSGIMITDTDVAQETTQLINMATREMIDDKKSGRVKSVVSVEPYMASNVLTHRMGLDKNMFKVGDKPMPPEKITEIYGLARRVASNDKGEVDQAKLSASVNAIAKAWNSPEGKKYREEFKGTQNETAFAQFLKDRLLKQAK